MPYISTYGMTNPLSLPGSTSQRVSPLISGGLDSATSGLSLADFQIHLAVAMLGAHQLYGEGGSCGLNIKRLVRVVAPNHFLKKSRVLVISHRDNKTHESHNKAYRFFPLQSLYSGDGWTYHVVLEAGGRVYDFDYTETPGAYIGDYLETMFGDQVGVLKTAVYSAVEYIREHRQWPHEHEGVMIHPLAGYIAMMDREYGSQEGYPLERRSMNYARWGVMRRDDEFEDMPPHLRSGGFAFEYHVKGVFNEKEFASLLHEELKILIEQRGYLMSGSVKVHMLFDMLPSRDVLKRIVSSAVRPLDIFGGVRFTFLLNDLPMDGYSDLVVK
ncbi:MAG: hypothetical protein HN337_08125 [Deltaproteobacteria bacterium]|nr:hypothetical protein [Deltaproteobacteria bacterium]